MYTDFPYGVTKTKGQIMLMYKNILYKLERERSVLTCMIKQSLSKGVKNLGEIDQIIIQNNKVDDILVQELRYRNMLNLIESREA